MNDNIHPGKSVPERLGSMMLRLIINISAAIAGVVLMRILMQVSPPMIREGANEINYALRDIGINVNTATVLLAILQVIYTKSALARKINNHYKKQPNVLAQFIYNTMFVMIDFIVVSTVLTLIVTGMADKAESLCRTLPMVSPSCLISLPFSLEIPLQHVYIFVAIFSILMGIRRAVFTYFKERFTVARVALSLFDTIFSAYYFARFCLILVVFILPITMNVYSIGGIDATSILEEIDLQEMTSTLTGTSGDMTVNELLADPEVNQILIDMGIDVSRINSATILEATGQNIDLNAPVSEVMAELDIASLVAENCPNINNLEVPLLSFLPGDLGNAHGDLKDCVFTGKVMGVDIALGVIIMAILYGVVGGLSSIYYMFYAVFFSWRKPVEDNNDNTEITTEK